MGSDYIKLIPESCQNVMKEAALHQTIDSNMMAIIVALTNKGPSTSEGTFCDMFLVFWGK